jgi:integrator complex subunit 9
MRLYCLNGDPSYPCFCLTIKGCTIMLDCSLNQKTILNFLPHMQINSQRYENLPNYRFNNQVEQQCDSIKEVNSRAYISSLIEFSMPEFSLINIEDIDCVLISNAHAMLALPYLTRMKKFRAVVYCTEPVLHMSRLLMEELTHHLKPNNVLICVNNDTSEYINFTLKTNTWKNYSHMLAQVLGIKDAHLKPHNWSSIYTQADVELCISKIKCVGFNQKLDLFGCIRAQPISSGHSMGMTLVSRLYLKSYTVCASSFLQIELFGNRTKNSIRTR